jgi:hypothetical protein
MFALRFVFCWFQALMCQVTLCKLLMLLELFRSLLQIITLVLYQFSCLMLVSNTKTWRSCCDGGLRGTCLQYSPTLIIKCSSLSIDVHIDKVGLRIGDGITFWPKSFNYLNTKREFNEDEVLQVKIEMCQQLL